MVNLFNRVYALRLDNLQAVNKVLFDGEVGDILALEAAVATIAQQVVATQHEVVAVLFVNDKLAPSRFRAVLLITEIRNPLLGQEVTKLVARMEINHLDRLLERVNDRLHLGQVFLEEAKGFLEFGNGNVVFHGYRIAGFGDIVNRVFTSKTKCLENFLFVGGKSVFQAGFCFINMRIH